mmetsp:Transcript_9007/g.27530  ORF Transcript_9007/g.27530 Transcript_9007/m.27530 type:complete len:316 (+) Transcript_9007:460-1407(+)
MIRHSAGSWRLAFCEVTSRVQAVGVRLVGILQAPSPGIHVKVKTTKRREGLILAMRMAACKPVGHRRLLFCIPPRVHSVLRPFACHFRHTLAHSLWVILCSALLATLNARSKFKGSACRQDGNAPHRVQQLSRDKRLLPDTRLSHRCRAQRVPTLLLTRAMRPRRLDVGAAAGLAVGAEAGARAGAAEVVSARAARGPTRTTTRTVAKKRARGTSTASRKQKRTPGSSSPETPTTASAIIVMTGAISCVVMDALELSISNVWCRRYARQIFLRANGSVHCAQPQRTHSAMLTARTRTPKRPNPVCTRRQHMALAR